MHQVQLDTFEATIHLHQTTGIEPSGDTLRRQTPWPRRRRGL
jgi:hypothetical protein